MFGSLKEAFVPRQGASLANAFSRLGWVGFWMQITIGTIPVVLTIYALAFGRQSGAGTRGGLPLIDWLTIGSLLLLAFTTLWSYRYTRLAGRISDQTRRPSALAVQRTAWTGVIASTTGILFSMLIMLFEVVHLLIYFLRAPQAGVPVVQTTAGGPSSWVSAADILSLLALMIPCSWKSRFSL
jgi:hypothetical protein